MGIIWESMGNIAIWESYGNQWESIYEETIWESMPFIYKKKHSMDRGPKRRRGSALPIPKPSQGLGLDAQAGRFATSRKQRNFKRNDSGNYTFEQLDV